MVDRATAAAAGFAVRVRREVRREPQIGRARARRSRGPAGGASARCAGPAQGRGPRDQGRELRDRRGDHARAAPRQADAGRRHAERVDPRRGRDLRRAGGHARRESRDREDRARPVRRRRCAPDRRAGDEPRGLVLPRHLFLRRRLLRPRAARARAPPDARAARPGVGETRGRPAAQGAVRAADPGLGRREGDRARRGSAADRVGVRQPAAHWHAAAVRSDRDLRTRRAFRRQPAQARPRGGHGLEHLHARTACRPRPSRCPDRRRSTRSRIRRRRRTSISSRAATAPANSPRISPSTTAPWQNSSSAGADGAEAIARGLPVASSPRLPHAP